MSNRKNSDLKKRLADLRINEPLRLSKPNKSLSEVPHLEVPREGLPQTGVGQNESPEIEPSSVEKTRSKNSQSEQPSFEKPQTKPPQVEATQNEKTHEISQGFFKLSHAVFSQPLLRELSGDCFRLFLWLSCRAWRFPDSDGTVRASVGYMESHLGMGHATVSRGLRALKETGLVSLEEVNFKRGNLWRIVPLALGNFDPENELSRLKGPQIEAPKVRQEGSSKRGSGPLSLSKKPPQNEQQIININKQKIFEESTFDPTQFEAALAAFESNVPQEARQTIMQEFMSREFPHGIFPPVKVIKNLVAMEWYSLQRIATYARVG